MSFKVFKQNMLRYMQKETIVNGESVNVSNEVESYDDFAKKLTSEYDNCIKRGFQQPAAFGKVPLKVGSTDLMETLLKLACVKALNIKEGNHTFIDDIGEAVVKGYWVGAELSNSIPPLATTPPAFLNISTTTAPISNPGTWKPIGPTPPLDDAEVFLDLLIPSMQVHLTTISGTYILESLYPGVPVSKNPSILPFTGYSVP
jgi:hypothetical protein